MLLLCCRIIYIQFGRCRPATIIFSIRWNQIKGQFTKTVKLRGEILKKDNHNEYNLWQRRYWEHAIKDESDMNNHVNYIHYNPVKHGLVRRVRDWPFSTFHQYVREMKLPIDWGDNANKGDDENFGE